MVDAVADTARFEWSGMSDRPLVAVHRVTDLDWHIAGHAPLLDGQELSAVGAPDDVPIAVGRPPHRVIALAVAVVVARYIDGHAHSTAVPPLTAVRAPDDVPIAVGRPPHRVIGPSIRVVVARYG